MLGDLSLIVGIEEITQILIKEYAHEDPQILKSFLQLMWDYFHEFTKNIREYRNFVVCFLEYYKEPLEKGEGNRLII